MAKGTTSAVYAAGDAWVRQAGFRPVTEVEFAMHCISHFYITAKVPQWYLKKISALKHIAKTGRSWWIGPLGGSKSIMTHNEQFKVITGPIENYCSMLEIWRCDVLNSLFIAVCNVTQFPND